MAPGGVGLDSWSFVVTDQACRIRSVLWGYSVRPGTNQIL